MHPAPHFFEQLTTVFTMAAITKVTISSVNENPLFPPTGTPPHIETDEYIQIGRDGKKNRRTALPGR